MEMDAVTTFLSTIFQSIEIKEWTESMFIHILWFHCAIDSPLFALRLALAEKFVLERDLMFQQLLEHMTFDHKMLFKGEER